MKFSRLFISILIFSILIFGFYPQIDLEVSSLFYDAQSGFYLKRNLFFYFIYKALPVLMVITLISLISMLIYQYRKSVEFDILNKKAIFFLLTFLLIGPGLITNSIFKEYSGRARPVKMVQFGGKAKFTPFYEIADECNRNCSFISGHVSASIFFIAFAFFYRSRKIFYIALGFALLMSLTRVVGGGHFLSDVVFALIINFAIFKLLYFFFYKEDASLDGALK
jgi:lipid A 4'-phosphatase